MLKLKELRQEKGLSQEQLALIINVKNYTVGNWEQKRSEPSIEDIIKLADYFQITTDELLGRENYATGVVEVMGFWNREIWLPMLWPGFLQIMSVWIMIMPWRNAGTGCMY